MSELQGCRMLFFLRNINAGQPNLVLNLINIEHCEGVTITRKTHQLQAALPISCVATAWRHQLATACKSSDKILPLSVHFRSCHHAQRSRVHDEAGTRSA